MSWEAGLENEIGQGETQVTQPAHSDCAPSERASAAELERQSKSMAQGVDVDALPGTIPAMLLILNSQRQIIHANQNVLRILNLSDSLHLYGLRPGEAFHCSHAASSSTGCGTTIFCRTCGALQAIVSAQQGLPVTRECRIMTEDGGMLDLRVWGTPVEINNEKFTVLSVLDIGEEKRRRALERVFFHDLLNAASGLRGLSELLSGIQPEDAGKYHAMIHDLAGKLIEDIQAQRDLTNAESHELLVRPVVLQSSTLINEVLKVYQPFAASYGVSVGLNFNNQDIPFISDKVLLRRVLGNLVKNAVEASQPGDTVSVLCHSEAHQVVFSVQNSGVIPLDIQRQLFQRSFSTKGDGRGLGTYSIKLFTEAYLKGKVSFVSAEGKGTVFSVFYPLDLASSSSLGRKDSPASRDSPPS